MLRTNDYTEDLPEFVDYVTELVSDLDTALMRNNAHLLYRDGHIFIYSIKPDGCMKELTKLPVKSVPLFVGSGKGSTGDAIW